MDRRFDPRCESARELARRHRDQEALLVAGASRGQLAHVVHATQERQAREHLVQCARCRHYDPRCPTCGFDLTRDRHGWLCAAQPSRWRDALPWNWRARKAPADTRARAWRHADPGGAGWTQTTSRVRASASEVPHAPPRAAAPIPPRAAPARAAPARPAAFAPAQRPPRPRPAAPAANALALAYASLGLAPEAKPDDVRAAYRKRAQEYHPDKVAHMAPEFRVVAEQKMKEVNGAYERIKRSWPAARK